MNTTATTNLSVCLLLLMASSQEKGAEVATVTQEEARKIAAHLTRSLPRKDTDVLQAQLNHELFSNKNMRLPLPFQQGSYTHLAHMAAELGSPEAVKEVLSFKKIKINAVNSDGETPLALVIRRLRTASLEDQRNILSIAQQFVNAGANKKAVIKYYKNSSRPRLVPVDYATVQLDRLEQS